MCKELRIFDFEYDDGMYGTLPYVFSQLIGNLPIDLLNGFLYALVLYLWIFINLVLLKKPLWSIVIFFMVSLDPGDSGNRFGVSYFYSYYYYLYFYVISFITQ